jgi:hypothetical protein
VWRERLVGSSPFTEFLGFSFIDLPRSYAERGRYDNRWAAGPLVPGVAAPTHALRSGDTLRFALPSATDSSSDHSGSFGTVTGRLLRGSEVVRTFPFGIFGSVPVPPTEEPYRLEVSTRRVEHSVWATTLSSETAWTFRSAQPAGADVPLPLLDLDYDLGLGRLNDARAGRTHVFSIGTRRLDVPSGLRLRSLELDVSYDDGQTWREARLWVHRDRGWALVRHPKLAQTNGFVGLRVRAEDVDGNTIEQTTLRAFQLRDDD